MVMHRVGLFAVSIAAAGLVDVEIRSGRQTSTFYLWSEEFSDRVFSELINGQVLNVWLKVLQIVLLLVIDLTERVGNCAGIDTYIIWDGWVWCQRDIVLVTLLALCMQSPLIIWGRGLGLLECLQHLQIFLIDLLDLFLSSWEIKCTRGAGHWHELATLPSICSLLATISTYKALIVLLLNSGLLVLSLRMDLSRIVQVSDLEAIARVHPLLATARLSWALAHKLITDSKKRLLLLVVQVQLVFAYFGWKFGSQLDFLLRTLLLHLEVCVGRFTLVMASQWYHLIVKIELRVICFIGGAALTSLFAIRITVLWKNGHCFRYSN